MKILLMGTPEFAVPTLDALLASNHELIGVVTQPDAPSGRGKKLQPPAVKRRALEASLAVYQPEKPRRKLWPALVPDLIVVIAYGHILMSDILDWPSRGCINLHASLLPKYRGAAPINWAIIRGETETGVTSMNVVENLDAGDMLLRRHCPIGEDETGETLYKKLSSLSAEVCIDTIEGLEAGTILPVPQVEEEATYAPRLKKEDAVIDWDMPVADICRWVRGLRPWPVAQTRWNSSGDSSSVEAGSGGPWLRVWMAIPGTDSRRQAESSFDSPPGTVDEMGKTPAGEDGVRVKASDGWVLLTEVQPEGKRRMDAKSFWQGYRLPAGSVLG